VYHSPPLTAVVVSLLRRYLRVCTRLCQLSASLGPTVGKNSRGPKDPSETPFPQGGREWHPGTPAAQQPGRRGPSRLRRLWGGSGVGVAWVEGAPGPSACWSLTWQGQAQGWWQAVCLPPVGARTLSVGERGGGGARGCVPLWRCCGTCDDEPQLLQLLLGQVGHKSQVTCRKSQVFFFFLVHCLLSALLPRMFPGCTGGSPVSLPLFCPPSGCAPGIGPLPAPAGAAGAPHARLPAGPWSPCSAPAWRHRAWGVAFLCENGCRRLAPGLRARRTPGTPPPGWADLISGRELAPVR